MALCATPPTYTMRPGHETRPHPLRVWGCHVSRCAAGHLLLLCPADGAHCPHATCGPYPRGACGHCRSPAHPTAPPRQRPPPARGCHTGHQNSRKLQRSHCGPHIRVKRDDGARTVGQEPGAARTLAGHRLAAPPRAEHCSRPRGPHPQGLRCRSRAPRSAPHRCWPPRKHVLLCSDPDSAGLLRRSGRARRTLSRTARRAEGSRQAEYPPAPMTYPLGPTIRVLIRGRGHAKPAGCGRGGLHPGPYCGDVALEASITRAPGLEGWVGSMP